jgi:hypothetical protein
MPECSQALFPGDGAFLKRLYNGDAIAFGVGLNRQLLPDKDITTQLTFAADSHVTVMLFSCTHYFAEGLV